MDHVYINQLRNFELYARQAFPEVGDAIDHKQPEEAIVRLEDAAFKQMLEPFALDFHQRLTSSKDESGMPTPFRVISDDCTALGFGYNLDCVLPVKCSEDEYVVGFRLRERDLTLLPALLAGLRAEYDYARLLILGSGYLTGEFAYMALILVRSSKVRKLLDTTRQVAETLGHLPAKD